MFHRVDRFPTINFLLGLALSTLTVSGCSSSSDASSGASDSGGAGATGGAGGNGGASTNGAALEPQDVTILYPYPSPDKLSSLLTADSSGDQGELIPEEPFALLPRVVSHPLEHENAREDCYLVAARANCAYDTALKDDACSGQLQLIFQVAQAAQNGTAVDIMDASIHAVYPLDDATFLALVSDLREAREAHGGFASEPLSVHPLLAGQGIDGSFAQDLAAIILRYAGESTLHKVTFITIDEPTPNAMGGEVWTFGAVEKNDQEQWESLEIPAFSSKTTKQVLTSVGSAQNLADSDFNVLTTPALPAETDLSGLFGKGAVSDESAAEEAYEVALALENPTLRSASDSDCITCHITHARVRGELLLGLTPDGRSSYYAEGAALEGATVTSAVGVRALGWSVFAPKPSDASSEEIVARAISQRVVNETVYTLEQMNPLLAD
jgi:hypothetical protein